MIGDALVVRAVEHALLSNLPVQEVLQTASAAFPDRGALFGRAARAAAGGDLRGALLTLRPVGMDPLVLAVAEHDPCAAGAASTRMSTVPRHAVLATPFLFTVGYLLAIGLVQVGVIALLEHKVLGILLALAPTPMAPLMADLLHLVSILWRFAFFALLVLFGMRRSWLLPGVRRSLRRMKLCLAATELTRTRQQAAQALVSAHDPRLAKDLSWTPEALESAARGFELEAHRRAARAVVLAKTVGGTVLALIALLVMGALYLTLPGIALVPA